MLFDHNKPAMFQELEIVDEEECRGSAQPLIAQIQVFAAEGRESEITEQPMEENFDLEEDPFGHMSVGMYQQAEDLDVTALPQTLVKKNHRVRMGEANYVDVIQVHEPDEEPLWPPRPAVAIDDDEEQLWTPRSKAASSSSGGSVAPGTSSQPAAVPQQATASSPAQASADKRPRQAVAQSKGTADFMTKRAKLDRNEVRMMHTQIAFATAGNAPIQNSPARTVQADEVDDAEEEIVGALQEALCI